MSPKAFVRRADPVVPHLWAVDHETALGLLALLLTATAVVALVGLGLMVAAVLR